MSVAEPVLNGDSALVGEVVREHAPALANCGFEYVGASLIGSNGDSPFPVFKFRNPVTGFELLISFSPVEDGLRGGFVVLVADTTERQMDLEDFLIRKGREDLTQLFSYDGSRVNVREFAVVFMQFLARLFATDLKPVAEGKQFEETPIDLSRYF